MVVRDVKDNPTMILQLGCMHPTGILPITTQPLVLHLNQDTGYDYSITTNTTQSTGFAKKLKNKK